MRLRRLLQPERVWGWTVVPPGPRLDPLSKAEARPDVLRDHAACPSRRLPAGTEASRPGGTPTRAPGSGRGHGSALCPRFPRPPGAPTHPGPSRGAGAWKAARSLFPLPPERLHPFPSLPAATAPRQLGPRRRSRGLPPRLPGGAVGAERQAARGTPVRLLHGGGNPAGPTCSLLHTPAPRVPGFGEFCRERAGRGLAKASSWPPGRRSLSVGQRV